MSATPTVPTPCRVCGSAIRTRGPGDWVHVVRPKADHGHQAAPRAPGRPRIGRPVEITLPDDLLALIDAKARDTGLGRPDVIRVAIRHGLGHVG